MTIDELLKSTLDELGVPSERLKFSGEADTFIVFHLTVDNEGEYADDEPTTQEHQFRIDIFSKGNYMALVKQAKMRLKAAGFYGISVNAEFFEESTGFNRISLDCFYMEVKKCE